MSRVHSIALVADPDKASLQLRIATCMILIYKILMSTWYLMVTITSFQHVICPEAKLDFCGFGVDPAVRWIVNQTRAHLSASSTSSEPTPFWTNDVYYRQLCWTLVSMLQTWQLFGMLFEVRITVRFSLYFEAIMMFRRVQISHSMAQWSITAVWSVVLFIVYMYDQTLRRVYRHPRLDDFAYRIPTPEISTYTVDGQPKVGVIVRAY